MISTYSYFSSVFSAMPQVPEGLEYFPAMWFISEVELPEKDALTIASVVGMPEFVRQMGLYSLAPVSILLLTVLCLVGTGRCNKVKNRSEFTKVCTSESSEGSIHSKEMDEKSQLFLDQAPSPIIRDKLSPLQTETGDMTPAGCNSK